jgi:hypothetical protein
MRANMSSSTGYTYLFDLRLAVYTRLFFSAEYLGEFEITTFVALGIYIISI